MVLAVAPRNVVMDAGLFWAVKRSKQGLKVGPKKEAEVPSNHRFVVLGMFVGGTLPLTQQTGGAKGSRSKVEKSPRS